MHRRHSCDLSQRAAVEKIRSEYESVLRIETAQRLIRSPCQLGICRHRILLGCGRKLHTVLRFFVQADEASLLAISVYEFLHYNGAEPAIERTASAVRRELRSPYTFARLHPVQVCVHRVRQFPA